MGNVFKFNDYKEFLRSNIEVSSTGAGYKAKVAKAMGAPASFLSQVLRTHVNLSLDHAFRLAEFWNLSEKEREFFLILVSFSRASTKDYRSHLKDRMDKLREEYENLSSRYAQPTIPANDNQWIYYSHWYIEATHMALTIPDLQNSKAIALRLGISEIIIQQTLKTLEQMDLVEQKGERWMPKQNSLHLSRDSAVSGLNHWVWRQKAMERFYVNRQKGLHYTAIHTLSFKDVGVFKQLILNALDETRKIVAPSKEEDLVCFNCDFFSI